MSIVCYITHFLSLSCFQFPHYFFPILRVFIFYLLEYFDEVFRPRINEPYINNCNFKIFGKTRGKALSTIWFGLSTAEFVLPVLITYLFLSYSWRTIWQGIALLILILLPLVILNTIKTIKLDSREDKNKFKKNIRIKSWKRKK